MGGYDKEDGDDGKLHADVHRQHIFGQHVADYMTHLMEEDEEAYKKQFSRYIKLGINPDGIEGMYKKAHTAIRANPVRDAKPEKKVTKKRRTDKKLTSEARKQKVKDQKEVPGSNGGSGLKSHIPSHYSYSFWIYQAMINKYFAGVKSQQT